MNKMNDHRTENDAIADVLTKLQAPVTLDLESPDGDHAKVIALAKGLELHSIKPFIDAYRTTPEFRHGTARFIDLDSFIAHTKRFADPDSVIFADPNPLAPAPALTAVLDYHHAGADSSARFGKHRGIYTFPLSEEWLVWTSRNGKHMPQAEFAEFIEGRILDIADGAEAGESAKHFADTVGASFASPSKLLELSRGLTLRVELKVRNAKNLATGEASIMFEAQHTDEYGGALTVPGAFMVALSVFKNGPLYRIPARLRYRHRDGKITWFYELYRADRAFELAFKDACDKAQKETALPLFLGSPE